MIMHPDTLKASKTFRPVALRNLLETVCDESFYFLYPPTEGSVNEANGDGDLLEIWDWSKDCSSITVGPHGRDIQTTPETIVYVR